MPTCCPFASSFNVESDSKTCKAPVLTKIRLSRESQASIARSLDPVRDAELSDDSHTSNDDYTYATDASVPQPYHLLHHDNVSEPSRVRDLLAEEEFMTSIDSGLPTSSSHRSDSDPQVDSEQRAIRSMRVKKTVRSRPRRKTRGVTICQIRTTAEFMIVSIKSGFSFAEQKEAAS